jgi:triosephosphate isomerase
LLRKGEPVRRPLVAGNWKMNTTVGEAVSLARRVSGDLGGVAGVDVVLCPPFTALADVGRALAGGTLQLGAQDVHWEAAGAYTGEISVAMLRDLGCRFVLVGHSERRIQFQEDDRGVARKTRAVLDAGLTPIVCVGETLEQRLAERTEEVLAQQVEGGLSGLADALRRVVVAYEPVWAIGTGRTATAQQAQAAHAFLRGRIAVLGGAAAADGVRLLYGGSLNPQNALELFRAPEVDGGLAGGASLDAGAFASIVRAAVPARAAGARQGGEGE